MSRDIISGIIASKLGIPHLNQVGSHRTSARRVIDAYCEAYLSGLDPNDDFSPSDRENALGTARTLLTEDAFETFGMPRVMWERDVNADTPKDATLNISMFLLQGSLGHAFIAGKRDRATVQASFNARQDLFAAIALEHLGISTLETRNSDSLDFHDVAVWSVAEALNAAYNEGMKAANNKVGCVLGEEPAPGGSRR
ncbi:DUF6900 domain-containing protein [Thalassospira xianhensis]|uniref:DUF6900 domain-containing protein n=1 Tax=Thalassospira xiamenensis TaxID=220697 RepID=A0A285TXT8_9PROT|nr:MULTISPECIES: hypothetical protein [Thalassospira]SOC30544.1 hypothetical protein SAMN05428964_10995 [Thalassospira xiamenensis]